MNSATYQQSSSIADFGSRISDSNAIDANAKPNPQPSGARQTAEGSPKGEAGGPSQPSACIIQPASVS
jgi:hypothetical protein